MQSILLLRTTLVCDEPPRSNLRRLAGKRAFRLGYARLSAPRLLCKLRHNRESLLLRQRKKGTHKTLFTQLRRRDLRTQLRATRSSAIASKNTYPVKQKASVLHSSYCSAIVRLHSCKFTNVAKKAQASPRGDACAFLAEKERFELSRRDNRPTPLAGAPLRPLEYFSVYSSQAAVCSRLQQRLLYTIFILLSTPFLSFFHLFYFANLLICAWQLYIIYNIPCLCIC